MADDADAMRDFCEDLAVELTYLRERQETRTLGQRIIAEHQELLSILKAHDQYWKAAPTEGSDMPIL